MGTTHTEGRRIFSDALIAVLKARRVACALSHQKLADKAGVSRQTIGKIEAGQIIPTMYTMDKIAKALGLTMSEFAEDMMRQQIADNDRGEAIIEKKKSVRNKKP